MLAPAIREENERTGKYALPLTSHDGTPRLIRFRTRRDVTAYQRMLAKLGAELAPIENPPPCEHPPACIHAGYCFDCGADLSPERIDAHARALADLLWTADQTPLGEHQRPIARAIATYTRNLDRWYGARIHGAIERQADQILDGRRCRAILNPLPRAYRTAIRRRVRALNRQPHAGTSPTAQATAERRQWSLFHTLAAHHGEPVADALFETA